MNPVPQFTLNGTSVGLADVDPTQSLLRWLKQERLNGTKEGCADGDCGACTVAMVETDGAGKSRYVAINSCLLPMGAVVGRELLTIEALAEGALLHPAQQALSDCSGSQCGYCTPGFVMSLFVGACNRELSDHTTAGNLCRCTGYKPIRAATALLEQHAAGGDRFTEALAAPRAAASATRLGSYHSPTTVAEAVALMQTDPDASWIAGATDLGVDLSHGKPVAPMLIALDRIADLKVLHIGEDAVRIGAGVPLAVLEHDRAGVFPALDDMLPWFAARQVKNRATFGGGLGSASPIGDLAPVLLALDASVQVAGPGGVRELPIDTFFVSYRKTALRAGELIVAVTIPRRAHLLTASYKVAKRQTDDISIVAASFAIAIDATRRVQQVRLAYGGVAAVPVRALRTEALLLGRVLDDALLAQARAALADEFTPLSDHRAGAAYRRALAGGLFAKFVAERL